MIHVENTVLIDKPTGQVFTLLGDPAKDPEWHFDVVEAEAAEGIGDGAGPITPGALYRWVFDYMGEGRKEATAEVKAFEPGRRLDIFAVSGGLVQTISYLVEPVGPQSSLVTRTLDLEDEELPPAMESEIKPHVHNRGAQYLTRLKQVLEGAAIEDTNPSCLCADPSLDQT